MLVSNTPKKHWTGRQFSACDDPFLHCINIVITVIITKLRDLNDKPHIRSPTTSFQSNLKPLPISLFNTRSIFLSAITKAKTKTPFHSQQQQRQQILKMAAARGALLKYLRVNVTTVQRNPSPFSLSFNSIRRCFAEEVRGSFLDKSEVTDRVISVVKNFQKVDPSKVTTTQKNKRKSFLRKKKDFFLKSFSKSFKIDTFKGNFF